MSRYDFATDPVADPQGVVAGPGYRFTVLTDGLIRMEWSQDGRFEDRASSFAVRRRLAVPEFRVHETEGQLEIVTARMRLRYDRQPFSSSGLSATVLGGLTNYRSVWHYGDDLRTLGGTARTLDEADGPIPLEPGVTSRAGFAVIDDSDSLLFQADGWIAPRVPGRIDIYLFAYGLEHAAAIHALHALSGDAPLLPRWALGNWWSRYHRYSADEYLTLMDRFRAEGIPIAVAVIDMDWHLTDVDPGFGSGWTGYTWNRALFPDPRAFMAALHARGKRVSLNVHPADGVRAFEAPYAAMCAALGRDAGSGDPVEFDVTDRAFMDAYFDVLHRGLEAEGVDFWWIDWQQGATSRVPGIDPLWVLNHFHYLDSASAGGRPLTFSRYAGPGSHRYPIGFSGDTVISWESLAFQPEFTATASNIGFGWWSHDIGGHMFGRKDDELTARWTQLGVFSPILRLHSTSNAFMTKEPWSFDEETRQAMTAALRLRQRLIPYLHTMNHRAAAEGSPLVQPLYFAWPQAPEAYEHGSEFLFGSALLVAAITRPRDPRLRLARVDAWLPEGVWVDLFTDLTYDGGRTLAMHRDIRSMPVLARAGAIVPLDAAAVPADDAGNPNSLQVLVVVGADGDFVLVEDDGAARPRIARTALSFHQATGTLTVHPVQGAADVLPALRDWTVTFMSATGPEQAGARVNGLACQADVARTATRLSVTVTQVPTSASLEIHIGEQPPLPGNDVHGRVFALLDAAQIEYASKTRVFDIVASARPLHVRLAELQDLALEPALLSAVTEIVVARWATM